MYNSSVINEFLLSKGVHKADAERASTFIAAVLVNGGYNAVAVKSQSVADAGAKYGAVLIRSDNNPFTVEYECQRRTAGLYEHVVRVAAAGGEGFSVSSLESRTIVEAAPVRPVAPPKPPTPPVEEVVEVPEEVEVPDELPEGGVVEEIVVAPDDEPESATAPVEVETVAEGDVVTEKKAPAKKAAKKVAKKK